MDTKKPKRKWKLWSGHGREGGRVGGPARAKKLTPERRKEIAQKAAQARWAKPRPPRKERTLQDDNERYAKWYRLNCG